MLHTIAGQVTLINPLVNSDLPSQVEGELVSAWHIVTIFLFATSIVLFNTGFYEFKDSRVDLLKFIAWMYILSVFPFIGASIWLSIFAPQWILLLPIGILTLIGLRGYK